MRVFVGILIILSVLQAGAAETCSQLFNDFAPMPFPMDSLNSPLDKANVSIPTVTIKDKILDQAGNSLLVLEKSDSSPWKSSYKENKNDNNDLQGDPRSFALVMGPKTAQYFGFHYISENKMIAPTVEAFNSYILKMNLKLKSKKQESIGIMFYGTEGKPLSNIEYLYRFAYESSLPLARSGHLAIHDISYHTLAILFQNNLIMPVRKSAQFILELKSKLEADPLLSPEEKQLAKEYMEELINGMVAKLDTATGNLAAVRSAPYGGIDITNDRLFIRSLYHFREFPSLINRIVLLSDFSQFITTPSRPFPKNLQNNLIDALARNYAATTFKFLNENQASNKIPEKLKTLISKYKTWAKEPPVPKNTQSQDVLINQLEARIFFFQQLANED
jgi:hypothetical protein